MVSGGGAFRLHLYEGCCALRKGLYELSLPSAVLSGQPGVIHDSDSGAHPHPATERAGTLILGFQPLELWEMFVYSPGLGYFCSSSLEGPRQEGRKNSDLDLEP